MGSGFRLAGGLVAFLVGLGLGGEIMVEKYRKNGHWPDFPFFWCFPATFAAFLIGGKFPYFSHVFFFPFLAFGPISSVYQPRMIATL